MRPVYVHTCGEPVQPVPAHGTLGRSLLHNFARVGAHVWPIRFKVGQRRPTFFAATASQASLNWSQGILRAPLVFTFANMRSTSVVVSALHISLQSLQSFAHSLPSISVAFWGGELIAGRVKDS